MMISWVMPVNPSHPYLDNDPAPSFAPTICAFHLGFSLVFGRAVTPRPRKHRERIEMRTSRLSLGIFALALLLLLLLIACSGSDGPSSGRPTAVPPLARTSPETDREALVALYNASGGPNWSDNENWLSDLPIGEWAGVTTNDNGRVTELSLHNNQLSGDIPPELGNLTRLESLYLFENQLSGEIPPELGNLINLERLDLSGNQLTGEIPPELGNLSGLVYLLLFYNKLSGPIPPELGNLSRLAALFLGGNQLSGDIPAKLGDLPNLTRLNLSDNQLSGCVPRSLASRLYKDFSDLAGLPFCP